MSPFAYRADDELAAALRDFTERDAAFRAEVVAYDEAHPGRKLLWARSPFSADLHAMGFEDGTGEVPDGLSRAKGRTSLIPRRGRAGEPWRKILAWARTRPTVEHVYQGLGVPTAGEGGETGTGGFYLAPTLFLDSGPGGVLIFCKYELGRDRVSGERRRVPHVEPIPLSEFYAVKERVDAEREADRATAERRTVTA